MTVAIRRDISGLLNKDDFNSDTSSYFTSVTTGGTPSWSYASGKWVQTNNLNADSTQRRNSITGGACVTIRAAGNSSGDHMSQPIACVCVGDTPDAGLQLPCYRLITYVGQKSLNMTKRYNGASSTLATTTMANVVIKDTYYYYRIYYDSANVYGRMGASALVEAVSAADPNLTPNFSAIRAIQSCSFEWFEIRSNHKVICKELPSGYYLRVSDGATTAKAAESSGTATVDAGAVLFPLASVSVYNGDPDSGGSLVCDVDTGDYADMGGGDEYTYVTIIEKELTTDAYVKATTLKTLLSDAYIKGTSEESITVDSIIAARLVKELSLDGYISIPQYVTISVDGYILGTLEFTFTSDGIISSVSVVRTYPIIPTNRAYPILLRKYPI